MREFKIENGKRFVLATYFRLHTYHPECAPEGALIDWYRSSGYYCAKCGEPLYKKSK